MYVYLVRATEWDTEVDCVCATMGIAERERMRLANEYGITDEAETKCYVDCIQMRLIDK